MGRKERTIFIGCGTGRCGTTSLSKLISGCKDALCMHKRRPLLPWIFNEDLFHERVQWFSTSNTAITGDVAYFYLPYLEKLIGVFPNLKVICLERDRQEVIDSFMWKTRWQNRWHNHDGIEWFKDNVWDPTYPKYDTTDKAEAIGAYWDEYRRRIRRIAKKFPATLQPMNMEELNTAQGKQKIFDFLALPEKSRRYVKKPRYNARKSEDRPWTKEDAIGWMRRRILTSEDIASVIPPGIDFILVDQEQIVDCLPAQYRAIPFLERDRIYWGLPSSDVIAINELKRLQRAGAQFIIFAWTAFWWLDYYAGFCNYLRSNYRRLIENDRIVGFDLRAAGQAN